MKKHSRRIGLAGFGVLALIATILLARPSKASVGNISKSDLAGNWQMTTIGQTGCGFGTTLYNFTVNGSGTSSNVSSVSHSAGCGDRTGSGDLFTVQTLSANGSGTANLTCGSGCGWNLTIQVAADRSTFNVIDVSPANPNNFIEGVAVHQ